MSFLNRENQQSGESGEQAPPQRFALFTLVLICCVGFLIADLLATQLFNGAFPAMVIANILTAQLTLVCVWGTLVHGAFWVRLPWTFLLLLVSWIAIAFGIRWENPRASPELLVGMGLIWFFGFAASFVPLKVAALAFGWKIVKSTATLEEKSQYSIRDMNGTLILAVIMAIGSYLMPTDPVFLGNAIRESGLNQPEMLIVISVFGVVSLLVKLPCIWIALAQDRKLMAASIASWSFYCVLLAVIEIATLSAVLGPLTEGEVVLGLIVGHQIMGALVLAVCLALRGMGYHLQRASRNADIPNSEDEGAELVV
ncbi:MAG: hypothetical protein AAFX06_17195 [Planctomycetota bacterium]